MRVVNFAELTFRFQGLYSNQFMKHGRQPAAYTKPSKPAKALGHSAGKKRLEWCLEERKALRRRRNLPFTRNSFM